MQNSRKLFELVSSLSKSERIYFKKFSSLHLQQKGSNYLRLFDLIKKQNVSKDISLGAKNLSSVKHYLYKFILRSLRNYYHTTNPAIEVKNLIVDIQILFHRGLYTHCKSLISSTKKIVLRNNLYVDYISVLKAEYDLLIMTKADSCCLAENVNEQRKVAGMLINSIEGRGHSAGLSQVSSSSMVAAANEPLHTLDGFQLPKANPMLYPIGYN